MTETTNNELNQGLDEILLQLSKGNTIEGLKKGIVWMGFEKVKEWKSQFGYQFHIYSNDHFLDNRPHFHILKESDSIDCRMFFDGTLYDCKGNEKLDKKIIEALGYFLFQPKRQKSLIDFWNLKNPQCSFGIQS